MQLCWVNQCIINCLNQCECVTWMILLACAWFESVWNCTSHPSHLWIKFVSLQLKAMTICGMHQQLQLAGVFHHLTTCSYVGGNSSRYKHLVMQVRLIYRPNFLLDNFYKLLTTSHLKLFLYSFICFFFFKTTLITVTY
jgi:hypothetical protein